MLFCLLVLVHICFGGLHIPADMAVVALIFWMGGEGQGPFQG